MKWYLEVLDNGYRRPGKCTCICTYIHLCVVFQLYIVNMHMDKGSSDRVLFTMNFRFYIKSLSMLIAGLLYTW